MSKAWVKVFSSEQAYMVEIVKALLEDEHIRSFVVNKRDSMHTHLTNGEVELYVSREEAMRASHCISKAKF